MKKWSLLLCLLFSCSLLKQDKKNLSNSINLEVEELKLENGLTALILPNPKLPIFSIKIFYKVGGKNEIPGITGASHFLEHMMFKGAKKYGKNTIDFIIEGSGGQTNAYTTNDQTVYYENLPSSQLEKILDIEADRMENLLLDKDDFEKERAVVLEERKMRYENSPRGQLYLELMQNLYAGTPYGTSVIGDISDLKTVTQEQIRAYFKKFYAPNNAIIVIAGDVNVSDTKRLIKEKFGPIPMSEKVIEEHNKLKDEDFLPKIKKSQIVGKKGESPNPIFMLAFPTVKLGHPETYSLDILSSILGSGKSSSLTSDYLLIEKPVATSIYAAHQQLEKSGFFFIGGELIKGIKVKEFRDELVKRLKGYCESEINAENIQKIKNNYLVDLYSSLDSNAGLAQFLGDRQASFGDWKYYRKELDSYANVNVQDVKKSCKDVFSKESLFVYVWNQNK